MDIGVLIGVVVSVVIGVAIIPVVSDMMKTLDTTNMSSATMSLINILPIIVVTFIIIGSVGFFVTGSGGNKEEKKFENNYEKTVSAPKNPMYFPVDKQEKYDISKKSPPVAPFPDVQLSESVFPDVQSSESVNNYIVSETKSSPKTSGAIKSFRK